MYSHDETVQAVHAFYRDLTKLPYFDESWLRVPPPEGWSAEELAYASVTVLADKTDTVKRLVKHLPYLRTEPFGQSSLLGGILLGYYTFAICYAIPPGAYPSGIGNSDGAYALPPHCIHLTRGDRERTFLILDTERGTITESRMFGMADPEISVSNEEYDNMPEEKRWRVFPTYPIREFFARRTRYYTRLVWMITPIIYSEGGRVEGRFHSRMNSPLEERLMADSNDDLQEWHPDVTGWAEHHATYQLRNAAVYNTHLRFGWPANFDRSECRRALLQLESDFWAEDSRLMEKASREAGDIV